MPWHQSKSDPRKVYDQAHGVVGIMQTAAQAALIVEAVNKLGPERYRGKESAEQTNQSVPAAAEQVTAAGSFTHTWQHDECCAKHLAKFVRSGKASSAETWECPKCGCGWKAGIASTFTHWTPVIIAEVIR